MRKIIRKSLNEIISWLRMGFLFWRHFSIKSVSHHPLNSIQLWLHSHSKS